MGGLKGDNSRQSDHSHVVKSVKVFLEKDEASVAISKDELGGKKTVQINRCNNFKCLES